MTFRGHGVFRWDQETQDYALHWFDSMGQVPSEFRGNFERGILTLECRHPPALTRAAFDFRRPKRYAYSMEVSPDGGNWFPFMSGTYTIEE